MRLPCCLNFNQTVCYKGEVSILSYCKNKKCKSEVLFRTENNRQQLSVECTGFNINVKHTEKAYITGEIKSKMLDMLKIDTPGVYLFRLEIISQIFIINKVAIFRISF